MDIETIDDIFQKAVKERILDFNRTRGRRKELSPKFTKVIPPPNRRFGRILDCGDSEMCEILSEVMPRMAEATLKTLLQRKPRPCVIALAVAKWDSQYLFRLMLPLVKRTKN